MADGSGVGAIGCLLCGYLNILCSPSNPFTDGMTLHRNLTAGASGALKSRKMWAGLDKAMIQRAGWGGKSPFAGVFLHA